MIEIFIKCFFAVILIEAITEILVKSNIFVPLRSFLFEKGQSCKALEWFHDLLDCGHCTSVWIGWFTALLLFTNKTYLINIYVDWFFIGLVLQRLSNILHNIIDRIKGKDDLIEGQGF